MNFLARMNGVVRISTIAVILCVAITGGSLIYKHNTAHACGNSIISASTTSFIKDDGDTEVIFSLWYNSCTQQNFTSANVIRGAIPALVVSVTRNAGPDGGSISASNSHCPSSGICNSPGVYSPDNTSYAFIAPPGMNLWTSSF